MASHLCLDTRHLFWQYNNPAHESWRPKCSLSPNQGGSGRYLELRCFLQKVPGSTGACCPAVVCVLEGHDYRWLGSYLPEELEPVSASGRGEGRHRCSRW